MKNGLHYHFLKPVWSNALDGNSGYWRGELLQQNVTYTYIHVVIISISLPLLSLFSGQAICYHAHVRSWGRLQCPRILSRHLKEADCTNQVNSIPISRSIQQRTFKVTDSNQGPMEQVAYRHTVEEMALPKV
jgi:hypothetical protein